MYDVLTHSTLLTHSLTRSLTHMIDPFFCRASNTASLSIPFNDVVVKYKELLNSRKKMKSRVIVTPVL